MLTVRQARRETTRLIIDRLWCVSDQTADGYETILPSGRAQIIFSLTDVALREHDPNHPQRGSDAPHVLQGPSSVPRRVLRKSQISSCGVSFQPGGAAALFGPIHRRTDHVIDLARFWNGDATRLRDKLQKLTTHEARLDLLESEIDRRMGDTSEMATVTQALDRLRAGMAVKDVCEELKLSPHIFRRLFLRNVGLTPKHYLGIERFRTALALLSPGASLSDVAFHAQFSDQSHMTREVLRFAAMTPGRLRASSRPYVGHVADPVP